MYKEIGTYYKGFCIIGILKQGFGYTSYNSLRQYLFYTSEYMFSQSSIHPMKYEMKVQRFGIHGITEILYIS